MLSKLATVRTKLVLNRRKLWRIQKSKALVCSKSKCLVIFFHYKCTIRAEPFALARTSDETYIPDLNLLTFKAHSFDKAILRMLNIKGFTYQSCPKPYYDTIRSRKYLCIEFKFNQLKINIMFDTMRKKTQISQVTEDDKFYS